MRSMTFLSRNTVFIQSPLDYADGIYDFNIYDKWGGLLFHSNDPIEGWDGTYNAKDLPEGVYVYTFRVKGLDDKIRKLFWISHISPVDFSGH